MSSIPDKPALEGLEAKWGERWSDQGTFLFDRARAVASGRDSVYSIDTPPPTASGSLHIGHVFSYTHTDIKARFERMRGRNVFYPMGWDDNGLPTERRVQNYYGVRCDPSLPYDPDFTPPFEGGDNKCGPPARVDCDGPFLCVPWTLFGCCLVRKNRAVCNPPLKIDEMLWLV
jgi:valyl-tRNA synthetase